MTKKTNIYNLKNASVEMQQELFVLICANALVIENGKVMFNQNLLLENNETKSLVKFTTLINKTNKLVKMVNKDMSLLERDIESDLWFLL